MSASRVYHIGVTEADSQETVCGKVRRLLDESPVLDLIRPGYRTALKLHFGEAGNNGFVRPAYLRVIGEAVRGRQAEPFLADTNTLYKGRRTDSREHLALAYEHGFAPDQVNAEVIIPDDTRPEQVQEVPVGLAYVRTAKIARIFWDADALVSVAHFKGHLMTGFGGVLKNIGMGCATREGKMFQHAAMSPFVNSRRCTGCGACSAVCPVQAIALRADKAVVDPGTCIGCASCIAACSVAALDINWESGSNLIQERMVEYAYAVLSNKKGRALFVNFALKITQECDCMGKDYPRIVPDAGIFLSADPVACDKACFDRVHALAGRDIFRELHPKRDGMRQLQHAARLGLGTLEYELCTLAS